MNTHCRTILLSLVVCTTALGAPRGANAACAPSALFGPVLSFDPHQGVSDLAIADIDNDGVLDVLAKGSAGLSVLLGTPNPTSQDGQLQFASLIPVAGTAITVADLNNDQIQDVVVFGGSSSFYVLLGVGDGTFLAPATYSVPSGEWSYKAVVDDFDGDGTIDLAMVSKETGYNDWFRIRLWAGNGAGAFTLVTAATTYGVSPFRMPKPDVVGHDVNGDGRRDIVVAHNIGGVSVFVANGSVASGAWLTERIALVPDRSNCHGGADAYWDFRFCLADVSGDGIEDIIYLNRCTGRLQASVVDSGALPSFTSRLLGDVGTLTAVVAAGDLDGDGLAEVVNGNDAGVMTNAILAQLQGEAIVAVDSALVGGARVLQIRDLDDDGYDDLVIGRAVNPGIAVRFGQCVEAEPQIAQVSDVPQDEGGRVKVSWGPSGGDRGPADLVNEYWVWRAAPPNLPARSSKARSIEEATPWDREGVFSTRAPDGTTSYWEFMRSLPASGLEGYGAVCETTGDSSSAGNALTQFFVQARTRVGPWVWASDPAAGYSVDNLAPLQPSPVVGVYGAIGVALHWEENFERDLAGYRLYGAETPNFEPSPANLISAQRDTGYFDAAGGFTRHYKLAAVDIHGNVSRFAVISPDAPTSTLASLVSVDALADRIRLLWYAGSLGGRVVSVFRRATDGDWVRLEEVAVEEGGYLRFEDLSVVAGRRYGYRLGIRDGGEENFVGETWVTAEDPVFALNGVHPNPSRDGSVTVQCVLARVGSATLEVFDVGGRRVAHEDVGALGPGRHVVRLGQGAKLSPGIYVVRLTQAGRTVSSRVSVLK